jgi:hypothetical protein
MHESDLRASQLYVLRIRTEKSKHDHRLAKACQEYSAEAVISME